MFPHPSSVTTPEVEENLLDEGDVKKRSILFFSENN